MTMTRESQILDRLRRRGMLGPLLAVAERNHVEPSDVVGRSRMRSAARARRELWSILRSTLDMSYPEIGSLFAMDHTSILAGVRRRDAELNGESLERAESEAAE